MQMEEGGKYKKPNKSPIWGLLEMLLRSIFIFSLLGLIVFVFNYKGILQSLHDYQQPACQVK